jgi:hypothetical protein
MSKSVFHVDFDQILNEVQTLEKTDKNLKDKLINMVSVIKDLDSKLHETIVMQPLEINESKLWDHYFELQREKLSLLDLSHEWKPLKEMLNHKNHGLVVLIENSIEESVDHVTVNVDVLRAHIDILEIKNSRRLSLMILITSIIISYLALWEVFAREFVFSFVFPNGLSPALNYVILLTSLLPMVIAIYNSWHYRKAS